MVSFLRKSEETKDHGKNTKKENLQNGQEEYGAEKLAYMNIWAIFLQILYFLQILVWNCFERLFRKISYLCLKKH